MNPFLLLSSLGVGFYVFVLIALYVDNRKRRNGMHVQSYASFDPDSDWEFGRTDLSGNFRHNKFSDETFWVPVAKVQLGAHPKAARSRNKSISAAAPHLNAR